jgi:tetratricopeptide (TPR) repeat protein
MAIRKSQLPMPAWALMPLMPLVLGAAFALWSSLCLADIPGYPSNIEAYDSREVAMLPRYCIYTQLFRERVPGGNNPAEIKRWHALMGETFDALHHYCWGLMKTNRATILARSEQDRHHYLTDSIREFDYVIERAPPDFVLLPEILTKRGETLVRLGRTTQGIADLQRAIELKPDYWPPYGSLSDYYKTVGEIAKARELLETAISFAPDSRSLKRRLAELGLGAAKPKRAPKPSPGASP